MKRLAILAGAMLLAGCGDEGERATLYRNSPLDPSSRVLFASFDAPEKGDYNPQNCGMVARALNANVDASAAAEGKDRDPRLGFWCERGAYKKDGPTPAAFESEFPTNSYGPLRW